MINLHHASCLDWLADYDGPLFDSAVTDPPYHLSSGNLVFDWTDGRPNGRRKTNKAGFMGKEWDGGDIAFRPETWRAVYDALKPGAHLVAFSGTRTYHRMACAIEDAGFEIRDQLAWVFGSGFPKSHDVSKGIDRARDDKGPWKTVGLFLKAARQVKGITARELCHAIGAHGEINNGGAVSNWELGLACPTWEQWGRIKTALVPMTDEMDGEVWLLNGRKGLPSDDYLNSEVVGEHTAAAPGLVGMRFNGDRVIRAATPLAAQWKGWGSALKPALEPICLARKPLSEKSIAANVLKHGTGALNIDACRVGTVIPYQKGGLHNGSGTTVGSFTGTTDFDKPNSARWPANLLHDNSDEVLAGFPDTDNGFRANASQSTDAFFGSSNQVRGQRGHDDSGSAARFFYSAKAGPLDRIGTAHATVKPVDVMRWLCRLVTPPGGHILEPFAGSGTTGIAAMAEGFDCTMIELEADHVTDIERKLAFLRGEGALKFQEHNHAKSLRTELQPLGGLFGEAA